MSLSAMQVWNDCVLNDQCSVQKCNELALP